MTRQDLIDLAVRLEVESDPDFAPKWMKAALVNQDDHPEAIIVWAGAITRIKRRFVNLAFAAEHG